MLFIDFYWDCPTCKKMNWESAVDEDKTYKCRGCQRKFILTFSVEVEEIEEYNEEKEIIESIKLVDIEVSSDSGQTWVMMTVNTRDLNPDTSPLKPGWLLKHNGHIYRVVQHKTLNMLQTEKVSA